VLVSAAAIVVATAESSVLFWCGSKGESCSNVSLTLVVMFVDASNAATKQSST